MKKVVLFGLLLVLVVLAVCLVEISSLESSKGLQDVRTVPQKEAYETSVAETEIPLDVRVPETVSVSSLTITGKTQPDADVFINEFETVSQTDGRFSVSIPLDEGENSVFIVVNDQNGLTAEKEFTVLYTSVQ